MKCITGNSVSKLGIIWFLWTKEIQPKTDENNPYDALLKQYSDFSKIETKIPTSTTLLTSEIYCRVIHKKWGRKLKGNIYMHVACIIMNITGTHA